MSTQDALPRVMDWCEAHRLQDVTPVAKHSTDTQAWFVSGEDRDLFLKLYPPALANTWAATEIAIAGTNLHPSIVPLRQTVLCREGTLLVYERISGDNLGPMDVRARFQSLPISERIRAVTTVIEALRVIYEAGWMIVDWYEGNMIYDFSEHKLWLFDWELCRLGDSFMLTMDSNYGSSRLMAPEEFVRGSRLDGHTLVYNLGRYALLTLPELAEPLAPILARATYPSRAGRFQAIRAFRDVFSQAIAALPDL